MAISLSGAHTAGQLAVQIDLTQACIDKINAAIANGSVICGMQVCDANGSNVTELLGFRLDVPNSHGVVP